MARRRKYHRRRRGRFAFLYKLLSVLAISAVIVMALTMFFRVNTIQVDGEQHYTREQIIETSGLKQGDNLFLLNKFNAAERLLKELPYIEEVRINRSLPDTLLISVKECDHVLAFVQDDTAWLISTSGKIVERRAAADAADIPTIDGVELLSPALADPFAVATEYHARRESLLSLLSALEDAGDMENVNAIHLGDASALKMEYLGRFTVVFNYSADYARGLRSVAAVVAQLQSNETGTIDLRYDDRVEFQAGK